jgi:hypothetical protein
MTGFAIANMTLAIAATAGAAGGFAGGFSGALASGASFSDALVAGIQGAVFGGLTGAASFGIGQAFGNVGSVVIKEGAKFLNTVATIGKELGRSVAHGAVGAGSNILQGGKAIHGFIAGAISSFGSSAYSLIGGGAPKTFAGIALQTAVMGAVGGTASELSGGSFASGAITGAFVQLFNHSMHELSNRPKLILERSVKALKALARNEGIDHFYENYQETLMASGLSLEKIQEIAASLKSDTNIEGGGLSTGGKWSSREKYQITLSHEKEIILIRLNLNKVNGSYMATSSELVENYSDYGNGSGTMGPSIVIRRGDIELISLSFSSINIAESFYKQFYSQKYLKAYDQNYKQWKERIPGLRYVKP